METAFLKLFEAAATGGWPAAFAIAAVALAGAIAIFAIAWAWTYLFR